MKEDFQAHRFRAIWILILSAFLVASSSSAFAQDKKKILKNVLDILGRVPSQME